MSQPNRLRPNTTALAMLRRGWTLITPDGQFEIIPMVPVDNRIIVEKVATTNKKIGNFPLTIDGFEAIMNEVINLPF